MSATFFVTSVPVMPMPTPMLARLIDGASFTPSPVMAAIVSAALPGLDDARLVLGLHAGVNAKVLDAGVELLVAHAIELRTRDGLRAVRR